jgi:hypothetical protein
MRNDKLAGRAVVLHVVVAGRLRSLGPLSSRSRVNAFAPAGDTGEHAARDFPAVGPPLQVLARVVLDYFLVTDHGPVVVDVKPEHLLAKPTVAYTFAWTRRLVEARGWMVLRSSELVVYAQATEVAGIGVATRPDSRVGWPAEPPLFSHHSDLVNLDMPSGRITR